MDPVHPKTTAAVQQKHSRSRSKADHNRPAMAPLGQRRWASASGRSAAHLCHALHPSPASLAGASSPRGSGTRALVCHRRHLLSLCWPRSAQRCMQCTRSGCDERELIGRWRVLSMPMHARQRWRGPVHDRTTTSKAGGVPKLHKGAGTAPLTGALSGVDWALGCRGLIPCVQQPTCNKMTCSSASFRPKT